MIAVIDYDAGNVRSVTKAVEKVGFKAVLTKEPQVIKKASGVVLPGVGAFEDCIEKLKKYNLINAIYETIGSGKPFLGICVGFQLLYEFGYEFGKHKGLGVLKGDVIKFEPQKSFKVPHMGWNNVEFKNNCKIFESIETNSYFYFVHSYYTDSEDSVVAKTQYICEFTSTINKNNVFGVQFHPEKSQVLGLKVYNNFCRLCEAQC